jgi:hypothetical protein
MSDYVVIVKLGEEAIHLEAESKEQAIEKAKEIIGEQYGYDLSKSDTVSYEIEGEVA